MYWICARSKTVIFVFATLKISLCALFDENTEYSLIVNWVWFCIPNQDLKLIYPIFYEMHFNACSVQIHCNWLDYQIGSISCHCNFMIDLKVATNDRSFDESISFPYIHKEGLALAITELFIKWLRACLF